jgi:hypothetical protein
MEEKKSAWQRYKENLGDTRPWDLVNPNIELTTEEEASDRFSICKECPELIPITFNCKKCGCFMTAKTKIKKATCPLGKW